MPQNQKVPFGYWQQPPLIPGAEGQFLPAALLQAPTPAGLRLNSAPRETFISKQAQIIFTTACELDEVQTLFCRALWQDCAQKEVSLVVEVTRPQERHFIQSRW